MAEPTNSDIIGEIRSNHAEVTTRLSAVENQVRVTNGQVRRNTEWISNQKAVEKYKASTPIVNKADAVQVKSVWLSDGGQKVFLAIAGLLTALSVAITAFVAVRGAS